MNIKLLVLGFVGAFFIGFLCGFTVNIILIMLFL